MHRVVAGWRIKVNSVFVEGKKLPVFRKCDKELIRCDRRVECDAGHGKVE